MAREHTCSTCGWFVRGSYRDYVHDGIDGYQPGSCNRHAPTERGFPTTRSTSFCGEHSAHPAPPAEGGE